MIDPAPVRGLWCATLTPLGFDGAIDHARMAAHVRALLAQGVQGVAPFGTTGEGPSFSVAARRAGLDALLAAGIPAARIVAATGCAAFADTVELTRHALSVGCPRCLVLPPFFFGDVTDAAVYRYYASYIDAIADARLAVYLYHVPQFSGVALPPEVVSRLAADYPHAIAGVKDSGGDFTYTQALLEHVPQLAILVGHEPDLPRLMRAGGAGTICGIANIFPGVVAPLLKPTVTAADEARIGALLGVIFRYPFLPAFKAIRAAQLDDAAWRATAPPWLPLDQASRESLLAALREAGFDAGGESAQ
jgi:4-hydroxy-tetrahydrodipicolinate synthase